MRGSSHVQQRTVEAASPGIHSRQGKSRRMLALIASLCFACGLSWAAAAAQTPTQVVAAMAANEAHARGEKPDYAFHADETSERTHGHRWTENVIETENGALRRLLAIDGKPLTSSEAEAEKTRIRMLLAHPDQFRRAAEARRSEEGQVEHLLALLPKAFLINPDGENAGCTRFAFRPNPAFQPSSYLERIAAAMAGTVSVKQPENRLCSLHATVSRPVQFGFGLLGILEQGGFFDLERAPVDGGDWKSVRISVHLSGKVLLLKSLVREQDVARTELRRIPSLSLAEAGRLILQ